MRTQLQAEPNLGGMEKCYMSSIASKSRRSLVDDLVSRTDISATLARIEAKLDLLLGTARRKEVYSTVEAGIVLRRKTRTIERLCREGRLRAQRATGGRGGTEEWRVSHDELERFKRDGPRKPLLDDVAQSEWQAAGEVRSSIGE